MFDVGPSATLSLDQLELSVPDQIRETPNTCIVEVPLNVQNVHCNLILKARCLNV